MDARGAAAATATAVLYGSSYVATAIALRSFSPLAAAALRGLLGAIVLSVLLLASASPSLRPRRLTPGAAWRLLALGLLSGPAFVITMNLAVALAGASITAFVAGLYAVLVALFAVPLLGERLEPATLAALGLAIVGAVLIGELHLGGDQSLGVAVALAAAVIFAAFLVLSRRWSAAFDLPGPTIGAVALGLSAVVAGGLLPLIPASGPSLPLRPDAVAAVVWLALGPGAVAMILVVIGMRRLPAGQASIFLLLNPPTAVIGSWLLLGERFTGGQVAGAVLILASMGLASGGLRRRRTSARSARAAPPG